MPAVSGGIGGVIDVILPITVLCNSYVMAAVGEAAGTHQKNACKLAGLYSSLPSVFHRSSGGTIQAAVIELLPGDTESTQSGGDTSPVGA